MSIVELCVYVSCLKYFGMLMYMLNYQLTVGCRVNVLLTCFCFAVNLRAENYVFPCVAYADDIQYRPKFDRYECMYNFFTYRYGYGYEFYQ
jgi:hypothetical protein